MSSTANERVAIVTVHGVADQLPGQTVRELARLLCHGADGPPRYGEGETHGVLIAVAPLPAHAVHAPPAAPAAAPGKTEGARLPRPGAPSDFYRSETQSGAGGTTPRGRAARSADDLGITLTDYLLSRYQPAERDALYESTRIALKRRADGRAVDLYELYWADYSRLQPGGARALSATYQLLFHLSTLARDVVDQVVLAGHATRAPRAWGLLQLLHAWSAWLLRAPAALLQMAMVLLFAFGMAALVPEAQQTLVLSAVAGATAAILGGMALLAWLRPPDAVQRGKAVACAVAAVASAVVAVAAITVPWGFPWLYFGTAALATGAIGLALVWRFGRVAREVKAVGALVMVALVASLFARGHRNLGHATTQVQWMLDSALNTGEYSARRPAVLVERAGGDADRGAAPRVRARARGAARGARIRRHRAPRHDPVDRAVRAAEPAALVRAVVSGRLRARRPLLHPGIQRGRVSGGERLPREPGQGRRHAVHAARAVRRDPRRHRGARTRAGAARGTGADAELVDGRPAPAAAQWSARLGAWLGRARRLLQSIFSWFVPLLAIAGGLLFLAFILQRLLALPPMLSWLDATQGETLVDAGKWLAGGAVTITALGARFTKTFGKLRVALDAILDIDNYFRDPPDRRPPRARIFSRFAALLWHLRERGYMRIVVVSHSQGTVISADLLRYLSVNGACRRCSATCRCRSSRSARRCATSMRSAFRFSTVDRRGRRVRRRPPAATSSVSRSGSTPIARATTSAGRCGPRRTIREAYAVAAVAADGEVPRSAPLTAPSSASAQARTRTTSATTPSHWRLRSTGWSAGIEPAARAARRYASVRGADPAQGATTGEEPMSAIEKLADPAQAARTVRAPRGAAITCRNWLIEAAYRMIQNNLDPEVAERPEDLVVYGGIGKAARNWECFDAIVASLKVLENDNHCWSSPASRSGCSGRTPMHREC